MLGVLGALVLALYAWRRGRRLEDEWRALARSQGWRCEPGGSAGISLSLLGRSHGLDWNCDLRSGPPVITRDTASRNITRLETVWSMGLPDTLQADDVSIRDARQMEQLQGMARPLLGAVALGPGGEILRAGLEHIRHGHSATLPTGHEALAGTPLAVRRLEGAQWLAALDRFARANAERQQRIDLSSGRLQIAVLGGVQESETLRAFIDSATLLALATIRQLQATIRDETS
ncbi:MAG TPA: hypothetical protein PKC23_07765 [Candidatus Desulfobacillus sp.]|nr:hypothetical protein [Candidatus Desulfobacillus sp.]